MRPDRAVVKKALVDAGGDKTKAAALLGCSRPTLYTWIYQLGLERLAGICQDRRVELDGRERKDTPSRETTIPAVKSGSLGAATLRLVQDGPTMIELPVTATVKLPEALWKRVRKTAIDRDCTVSAYVAAALEKALSAEREEQAPQRRKTQ